LGRSVQALLGGNAVWDREDMPTPAGKVLERADPAFGDPGNKLSPAGSDELRGEVTEASSKPESIADSPKLAG
jgi:hypothetical protein